MVFENQTFSSADHVVDGNDYVGCTFSGCKIVYAGGDLPKINNCTFDNCNWQFDGAADRTLVFMKLLYHGMGEHGPELIESLIRMIRQPPQ